MSRNPAPGHPRMHPDQESASISLTRQITDAAENGLVVPCVLDPLAFDLADGPAYRCWQCPVLQACEVYRQTGAVTHGILAGGPADRRPRRRRNKKPASKHQPPPGRDAPQEIAAP